MQSFLLNDLDADSEKKVGLILAVKCFFFARRISCPLLLLPGEELHWPSVRRAHQSCLKLALRWPDENGISYFQHLGMDRSVLPHLHRTQVDMERDAFLLHHLDRQSVGSQR